MILKILRKLLPHLAIILAGICIVLLVIDMFFNSAMVFVNNYMFKWLCLIFCFITLGLAGVQIHMNHTYIKRKNKNASSKYTNKNTRN